ncbi:MarR family transcriptional regulator [Mycolicibacterium sp. 050232]|uniref:MarR family winged helix-turn-helix transcriptional regulator n=1 Tax=Mycolicibacterium sp. 050232 TaxID=3113982 RepID=UPI002E290449|nr:MarR family transcriptional regulator [Mycolicibacterium sp. 050232]MED5815119.1 MarR family transcriptional regulator [Mycolicibacterium sp. 050232]
MTGLPNPELALCSLPEVTEAEIQCWRQFFDASTGMLAAFNDSLMAAHGLRLFDVLMLDMLAKSDNGSARMSDLANAFMMTSSRATEQVRRLKSQGLVHRTPDPNDRRGVLATITPAGRARLGPALFTYARNIRAHYLNQMSRQQMIALGDSCRRVGTEDDPE